jgi:hypothetical protein
VARIFAMAAVVASGATGCSWVFDLEPPSRRTAAVDAAIADSEPDAPIPDAAPMDFHVRIEALIDGRSELIITPTTAQWHHYTFVAPGRYSVPASPTKLSGVDWYPKWPDIPDAENRDCDCVSDTYVLAPGIPRAGNMATVTPVSARGTTTIVQSPSVANDYTLVLRFSDVGLGGADWYVVDLDVVIVP